MYAAVPSSTPTPVIIAGDVIVGDARDVSAGRPRLRVRELRQPEVEHLHRAVGRDLDVRRLQIAMDDPLLVRRFERLGDLLRDRQRFVERNRLRARCDRASVVALDQFQDERVRLAAVLEPVDRADVRMVQRGEHLRFALEAREAIRIARERVGQDLQRDVAIQLRIARAIHLAHAAGAKGRRGFRTGRGACRRTTPW